jgi:BlaI family penicillinase repressor
MRVLWGKARSTAREVVAALEPQTQWNAKTILTLLNRLVQKGAVAFTKEGRLHKYQAAVSERDCVRAETRSFVDRVFGGAVRPMLAHFVQDSALSDEDVAELRRILDENAKRGRRNRPRGSEQ